MDTLVIYATKHGTTARCASILSEKLTGKVDLYELKAGVSPDLEQYDRVIIGGSICAGRIQKDVSTFCSQNAQQLKDKKLGLFICCMFASQAEAQLNGAYPQELLNRAAIKESFGGELKFSDMSFMEKTLTKMVSRTMAKSDARLSGIDFKKDVSLIDYEGIERFAQSMNIA